MRRGTAAGVALCLASAIATAAPEDDAWLVGHSPHFTVYSNGAKWRVKDTLEELERMRTILRAAFAHPEEDEPILPVTVFAFAHREDFEAFYPGAFAGRSAVPVGLFVHEPFQVDIFLTLAGFSEAGGHPSDQGPTLRHEYHHLYFDREAPWAPVWLREGLADLWANATLDGKTLEVGRIDGFHANVVKNGRLIPLDDLVKVNGRSPEYREAERVGMFYAESMLFTQFLLLKEPDGEAKMARFGTLLSQGIRPEEALATSWGPMEEIRKRFEGYTRQMAFPLKRATLTEVPGEVEVAIDPVTPTRIIALEAELAVSARDYHRAETLLAGALKGDSTDALALETKGRLEAALKRRDSARWYFNRAVEAPGASFSAHYQAALFTPRDKDGRWQEPERVEAELNKTLALDSRYCPAMILESRLVAEKDPPRAVELAASAAKIDPGNPIYEIGLARALKKAHRDAEAAVFVGRAVTDGVNRPRTTAANLVCWEGALAGFSASVMPACEAAVKAAPNDGQIRDSRGLARALAGDKTGALEDFHYAVEHAFRNEALKTSRTAWIAALEAGKDPFTPGVLASLEEGGSGMPESPAPEPSPPPSPSPAPTPEAK